MTLTRVTTNLTKKGLPVGGIRNCLRDAEVRYMFYAWIVSIMFFHKNFSRVGQTNLLLVCNNAYHCIRELASNRTGPYTISVLGRWIHLHKATVCPGKVVLADYYPGKLFRKVLAATTGDQEKKKKKGLDVSQSPEKQKNEVGPYPPD